MSRKDPFPQTQQKVQSQILKGFINYSLRNYSQEGTRGWRQKFICEQAQAQPCPTLSATEWPQLPQTEQLIPTSTTGLAPTAMALLQHQLLLTVFAQNRTFSKRNVPRSAWDLEELQIQSQAMEQELRAALSRPEKQQGSCARGAPQQMFQDSVSPWLIKKVPANPQITTDGLVPPVPPPENSMAAALKAIFMQEKVCKVISQWKKPSVLLRSWRKSPNQPPRLWVECFDPFRGLWLSMVQIYWQTISSLRSIWCDWRKLSSLCSTNHLKVSWCTKKNKIIKRIHCFPTSVQH